MRRRKTDVPDVNLNLKEQLRQARQLEHAAETQLSGVRLYVDMIEKLLNEGKPVDAIVSGIHSQLDMLRTHPNNTRCMTEIVIEFMNNPDNLAYMAGMLSEMIPNMRRLLEPFRGDKFIAQVMTTGIVNGLLYSEELPHHDLMTGPMLASMLNLLLPHVVNGSLQEHIAKAMKTVIVEPSYPVTTSQGYVN
jgi:hypothetical protein